MKPFPWKCGECGQRAVHPATLDTYSAELDHDGRTHLVTVRQFAVARCERCGAVVLDDAANCRLSEALRAAAGLLQPSEIRAGRAGLGLTQKELAFYLQIAEATLSRWETGAQIQQRSMDRLLRGFFVVPEFRRYLGVPDPGPTASDEPFRSDGPLSREVTEGAIEPPPTPLLADPHPPRRVGSHQQGHDFRPGRSGGSVPGATRPNFRPGSRREDGPAAGRTASGREARVFIVVNII